jgi:hypothetical protein
VLQQRELKDPFCRTKLNVLVCPIYSCFQNGRNPRNISMEKRLSSGGDFDALKNTID